MLVLGFMRGNLLQMVVLLLEQFTLDTLLEQPLLELE
jgi:hypothetical protein